MRRKKHRTDRPLMPGKRPAIPRKGRAGKLRFSGTCWRFTTDLLGLYGGGAIAVGYPVCLHTEVSLSHAARLTPRLKFKKPRFHMIANSYPGSRKSRRTTCRFHS